MHSIRSQLCSGESQHGRSVPLVLGTLHSIGFIFGMVVLTGSEPQDSLTSRPRTHWQAHPDAAALPRPCPRAGDLHRPCPCPPLRPRLLSRSLTCPPLHPRP
eukprot:7361767-Pyramimonas_sp.AAC.1